MRLRFLVLSLAVLVLSAGTGYAQTFTGTLDGYWSINTITPINGITPTNPGGNRFNNFRAFDFRDQTFSLNYGEIAVDYKPNDVGIRVDIGFGDAADVVHSFEPAGQNLWRHIQQAYVTGTKDKFTLDFGKFVTNHGAEVIETKDNWNYSRGLLFTWAIPFYHFGARATYQFNDKVTLGTYVVNGWNNVKDNNTAKSVGFMGTFKPHEKVTLVTNFLWGKESSAIPDAREMYDGTLMITLTDRITFMANYDYGRDHFAASSIIPGITGPAAHWQGVAGYLKAKAGDKLTLSTRYEWFDDHDGLMTGTAQELQSATGTATIPWSDLNFWLEFRRDWGNRFTFLGTNPGVFGPVTTFREDQTTFTIGLTYTFTKMVQ